MVASKKLQIVLLVMVVFLVILGPLALFLNWVAPGGFRGFWSGVFYIILAGLCSAAIVFFLIRFSPGVILNERLGGNRDALRHR